MTNTVGVWIDHRRALIVFVDGKQTDTHAVTSHEQTHAQRAAVPADDIRQIQSTAQLNEYYNELVSLISDAKSILILGPGEAKGELRKRLDIASLGGRTVELETSDKITDPQIVAVVRGHFLTRSPRRASNPSAKDTATRESVG